MTSNSERVSGLYVWTQLEGTPVIAGRFDQAQGVGTFYYANSYLERDASYPLDPINLPLVREKEFHTRANAGVFGVLLDAGPDRWGQRVLSMLAPSRPCSPLEFLLAGNGDGCGSLLFSLSRGQVKRPKLRGDLSSLAAFDLAADALLQSEEVSAEMRLLMQQGSSLGGARRKTTVLIDGFPYMAKFNEDGDIFNEARAEFASLNMARAAGITVSTCRIETVIATGHDVLLVRRFDFDERLHKRHYISAHALMNLHKVQEGNPDHGYPGLAALVRRCCVNPIDSSRELFRRLCFRLLIGDTDDHAKNYGFLLDSNTRLLEHSPFFDVLPHPRQLGEQAMGLGVKGRERSLQNLLSLTEAYGLSVKEAEQIVGQQRKVVCQWRDFYREAGLSLAELQMIEPSMALAEV